MISIECSKCLRKLRVSDDAAGKTAKCPCGESLRVPLPQRLNPKSADPVPVDTLQYFSHGCECGRTLRVAKGEKPKLAKCPCGSTFSVPSAELTASQPTVTKAIPAQAIPLAKPVELSEDHSFPDLPSYHAPPVSYRGEISASVASAPIRTSGAFGERPTNQSVASSYLENARQESSNSTYETTGGWSNFFDATVIGGLVVMLVAVGWFVAGLAADVIFFYPPGRFILRMITVVKGIMSNG